MITNGVMTGLKVLFEEAREFVEKGTKGGFAKPQSVGEGSFQGKYMYANGKLTVDCTRLDYLSLGQSHLVKEIMKECIEQNDISCPSSQMAMKSGATVRLEKAIAEFHKMKDSLIFLCGYSANENVVQGLGLRMNTPYFAPYIREVEMGKYTRMVPTEFFVDGETHYSLKWGIKIARLKQREKCLSHEYPTTKYDHLIDLLEKSREKYGDRVIRIIVSDTISSMSGIVYNVQTLCEIAEEYDCLLYLDEAHAIASVGEEGRGIASELPDFERFKDRLIIMGTLTKAVSQLGGYVSVPDENLGCLLRICSPQYIFSAPLPPWLAEVVIKVLSLIQGEYGKEQRKKLQETSSYLRYRLKEDNFDTLGSQSQIIPVLIGEELKCIQTKEYLEENGFTASAFICPAVSKGKAILRFSLCSDITSDEINQIVAVLQQARSKFDF